jgi:hypothetical protein
LGCLAPPIAWATDRQSTIKVNTDLTLSASLIKGGDAPRFPVRHPECASARRGRWPDAKNSTSLSMSERPERRVGTSCPAGPLRRNSPLQPVFPQAPSIALNDCKCVCETKKS